MTTETTYLTNSIICLVWNTNLLPKKEFGYRSKPLQTVLHVALHELCCLDVELVAKASGLLQASLRQSEKLANTAQEMTRTGKIMKNQKPSVAEARTVRFNTELYPNPIKPSSLVFFGAGP